MSQGLSARLPTPKERKTPGNVDNNSLGEKGTMKEGYGIASKAQKGSSHGRENSITPKKKTACEKGPLRAKIARPPGSVQPFLQQKLSAAEDRDGQARLFSIGDADGKWIPSLVRGWPSRQSKGGGEKKTWSTNRENRDGDNPTKGGKFSGCEGKKGGRDL